MDPFTISAAVVLGTMQMYEANRRNSAIGKSMESVVGAQRVQQRQEAVAAALDRKKNIDSTRRLVGALRVAGGESGGVDGSYAALIRQADSDAAMNSKIIGTNLNNRYARIGSESAAQLAQLRSAEQIPLLEGAKGAVQGALIGNALGGLFAAAPATGLAAGGVDFAGSAAPPLGAIPTGIPGQILI